MTENDISLISDSNLDCIIRCGSGILRGDILGITKFGVISFHHGDNRVNRGGPSGFWEVLKKEPSSGFIIQKLTEELDGGEVLFRGNMMTTNNWFSNNAQLLEKSNIFLMKMLCELAETGKLSSSEVVSLHGNQLYKIDSNLYLLSYIFKVMFPKAIKLLMAKLLSPKIARWSVAYGRHENFSKSLWRYNEIQNPKGRFLADPFIIEHCNETFIFVEDFFFEDQKGRISAVKLTEENYDFLDIVLEEDFHLSFPFVFKEGDDIYMIPESSANLDIRLYKSVNFPFEWEFQHKLMNDVDAADTMVFKVDGTWFMLTNICSARIQDHQSELHIFYSKDLQSENWIEIKSGNPVSFDPLRGRNGGFFEHNEKLYRVNQAHGHAHYGQGFRLNEIVKISSEEYIEKEVAIINPNFKKAAISSHHFSANTKIAAVDFARYQRIKKELKT